MHFVFLFACRVVHETTYQKTELKTTAEKQNNFPVIYF